MKGIYEPTGRAKEYARLACNLYAGCTHGCTYCYAPGVLRRTREDFNEAAIPRKGILEAIKRDAAKLAAAGCTEDIHLCFTCDPWPANTDTTVTREALKIIGEAGLKATVLTKGGTRAERDFDLMAKYDFRFGTTMVFFLDKDAAEWEPRAATVTDRINAIMRAYARGIRTWVSLEPVVDPRQTLVLIDCIRSYVGAWKVGKWNHDARANDIDWPKFLRDVTAKLDGYGASYYIKDDLQRAGYRERRP